MVSTQSKHPMNTSSEKISRRADTGTDCDTRMTKSSKLNLKFKARSHSSDNNNEACRLAFHASVYRYTQILWLIPHLISQTKISLPKQSCFQNSLCPE
jgi:hypothetical protein